MANTFQNDEIGIWSHHKNSRAFTCECDQLHAQGDLCGGRVRSHAPNNSPAIDNLPCPVCLCTDAQCLRHIFLGGERMLAMRRAMLEAKTRRVYSQLQKAMPPRYFSCKVYHFIYALLIRFPSNEE